MLTGQAQARAEPIGGRVRVLIVDDHPLVRRGLCDILDSADFCVSEEADGIQSARSVIEQDPPDLILMDLILRDGDALGFIREVRSRHPRVHVLVISMHDEELYAERAVRAGANGYLQKGEAAEHVVVAIRDILAGRIHLSAAMSDRIMHRVVKGERSLDESPIDSLSDRELQVFHLLGRGLKTRDIARELGLSVKTIDTYRDRMKAKLALDSTAELVRYAVAHGMSNIEYRMSEEGVGRRQ